LTTAEAKVAAGFAAQGLEIIKAKSRKYWQQFSKRAQVAPKSGGLSSNLTSPEVSAKGLEVLSPPIGGSLIVRGRHFVLSSIAQHRSEICLSSIDRLICFVTIVEMPANPESSKV
jgi:hypothetical protein